MKKVLIITYYWPPSGGAGVQRWLKFVKYLPELNFEPYILTVDPDKASYPILDKSLLKEVPEDLNLYYAKTFELFSAYKKISGKKEIPFGGFANESSPGFIEKVTRFIRGNFFIPDARKGWNKYAFRKACEIIENNSIDCIITTSPPHSSQLIGLQLKNKYNLPWIVDLRDPWTDIYYYNKFYPTSIARKIDAYYEKNVLLNADKILVVSNSIKQKFLSKADIKNDKIDIIPNGFDEDDFNVFSKPSVDSFVITYTGTLTGIYDVSALIKALKYLRSKFKIKYTLRFVGKISEEILKQFSKEGIEDIVEVHHHVKHSESISYLMKSTVLLLVIPKIENNEGILTGKLFEYLASKKPILCIGPSNGDAAMIIKDCNAGKTYDYSMNNEVVEHLSILSEKWLSNPNLDLDNDLYKKYSRKELTKELVKVLNDIAK